MKNVSVPDDYRKIAESDRMVVYEVKSDDRFIEFICKSYNINLCLCIDKQYISGYYMCMCHYGGLDIDNYTDYSTFSSRVIAFRNEKGQFNTVIVDFFKYDSFQLNIAECIKVFKMRVVDVISKGFNILTVCYSNDEDFGIIPYGSSEKEILMKMELMGLIG